MSMLTLQIVDAAAGGNPVGGRIARWLKPYQYKEVARLFAVEPRTANAWKAGNLPQMRHLTAMVERWGIEFLEYIFAPVLAEADLDLEGRLESIERSMAVLRGDIREKNMGSSDGAAARRRRSMARPAGPALARPGTARVVGIALAFLAVGVAMWPGDDHDALARHAHPPRPGTRYRAPGMSWPRARFPDPEAPAWAPAFLLALALAAIVFGLRIALAVCP
jgi:hypothetical protein